MRVGHSRERDGFALVVLLNRYFLKSAERSNNKPVFYRFIKPSIQKAPRFLEFV